MSEPEKRRQRREKLSEARRLISEVRNEIDDYRNMLALGDCNPESAMLSERLTIILDIFPTTRGADR